MNTPFTAAQIADLIAGSDSLIRFVNGLSGEQAKDCIEYELAHERRQDVLALLAGRAAVAVTSPAQMGLHFNPAPNSANVRYALQLALSHVRCPLEGHALRDLRESLTKALADLGTH